MCFKKPREVFIQDIMAYKNLVQFFKIHHGVRDIGSVPRPIFKEKTGKLIGQPIANEEEMTQKS